MEYLIPGHSALKILFAEDNELNRFLLTRLLRNYKDTFDFAENGEEALKMAKQKKYDIIFMDLNMPLMNGYQSTQNIRSLPHESGKVPIIAMTAGESNEDFQKCIESGMNDLIQKPFEVEELLKKIKSTLNLGSSYEQKLNSSDPLSLNSIKDKETKSKMLEIFTKQKQDFVNEFKDLILSKNWDMAAFEVHKMKSTATAIGIPEISRLLVDLEKLISDKNVTDSMDSYTKISLALSHAVENLAKS